MTDDTISHATFTPEPAPAAPKRHWKLPTAIGVACLLLGVAMGSGGASGAPAAAPKAAPVTTTVTETEPPIEKVPSACLSALDGADDLRSVMGEVAGHVAGHLEADGKVFTQISEMDFEVDWYKTKMQQFTDDIADATERVKTNSYAEDAQACRSAAE
jgi:hypothetical protein